MTDYPALHLSVDPNTRWIFGLLIITKDMFLPLGSSPRLEDILLLADHHKARLKNKQ